jgi:hypothetical protein
MAIDTDAKKLSLMSLGQHFQAALPATGTLNQADLQHTLWGYIDPLWGAAAAAVDRWRRKRNRYLSSFRRVY